MFTLFVGFVEALRRIKTTVLDLFLNKKKMLMEINTRLETIESRSGG